MLKKSALVVVAIMAFVSFNAEAKGGHGSGGHYSFKSTVSTGDHVVHSYVKKDGTFVQSYHATNPDGTKNNNYSTVGNVNPYTGKPGTKPGDEGYSTSSSASSSSL